MADINIVQAHSMSPAKAREAAQQVADKMARDYQLDCQWDANVLTFARSGVQGALTLQARQAEMVIRLGFPMSAFSSAIEAKVADNMRKVFGAGGAG
ncbi:MAG: polyhydroxyalkanoic acid system family protein, partial [Pseudomonadota bacterium]|nr:polyhydroxyalkanoic acid system family protein [Pseudomonadota bacterium]